MNEEKDILAQIAKGDTKAFEFVYKNHYSNLLGFATRFCAEEAHEIVQDCLLKLWEKREDATAIESLKAYLFRSVRNACLNHLKHLEVEKKYQNEAAIKLKQLELKCAETEPSNPLFDKINHALDQIPEQRKKIFKLSFFEGYKAKEIAEQYDISERTVHTHVYNAMKFLRKTIKKSDILLLLILQMATIKLSSIITEIFFIV